MKAGEVRQLILQGSVDAGEANTLSIFGSDERELTQEEIDELYDLLGTALVNIGSAMNKLRPNTTYYKENE